MVIPKIYLAIYNGIYNIKYISSFTQIHYNYKNDFRLLDTTTNGKMLSIFSCLYPNR